MANLILKIIFCLAILISNMGPVVEHFVLGFRFSRHATDSYAVLKTTADLYCNMPVRILQCYMR